MRKPNLHRKYNIPIRPSDVIETGKTDIWTEVHKVSSQREGYTTTTYFLPDGPKGGVLLRIQEQRSPKGDYAISESVVHVENLTLQDFT